MSAPIPSRTATDRWRRRKARAASLATRYPYAAEVLQLYQHLASFQGTFYNLLTNSGYPPVGSGGTVPGELDLFLILPQFQPWLRLLASAAPAGMAAAARQLANGQSAEWERLLETCWRNPAVPEDVDPIHSLIGCAFLQPVAECLAEGFSVDPNQCSEPLCPFCGRKPVVGVLRPEGEGGKRSLVCAMCAVEWSFRRLVCPACGEEDVYKLPVYTASDGPPVRVEACDTCRNFIKTVDLTQSGIADPLVDELASMPLTLWAVERGYRKLQPNLLGM